MFLRRIFLILDSKLNNFPFESLPIMRLNKQTICRFPTYYHLKQSLQKLDFNSNRKSTFLNSLRINPESAFFLLNPSKDLEATQKRLEPFFQKWNNWEGFSGESPDSSNILKALKEFDIFV